MNLQRLRKNKSKESKGSDKGERTTQRWSKVLS